VSQQEIYVFRAGSLGDSLVALPAWKEVCDRHSGQPIHLITPAKQLPGIPDTATVFAMTGRLGNVIRYDTSRGSLKRAAAEVQALGSGIVYGMMPQRPSLHHVRDWMFMRGVVGLRTRGFGSAILSNFQRGPFRHSYSPLIEWRRLLSLVGSDRASLQFPLLSVPDAARAAATCSLAPLEGRPLLVVCPGSKMPAKLWPIGRYCDTLRRFLTEQDDAAVVLVGSPQEKTLCEALVVIDPSRVLNLAGALTVEESAAVCEAAICYFGNDTGAMHLAAAMGRPCVAIFSARDYPLKWVPYGDGHENLRYDPPCSGCMLQECVTEQLRCLTAISADQALDALNRCWRREISKRQGPSFASSRAGDENPPRHQRFF